MSNAKIQLRLPEHTKDAAKESRTTAARAKTFPMCLGAPGQLDDDDRLDAADEP